jgi:hypothetical protein
MELGCLGDSVRVRWCLKRGEMLGALGIVETVAKIFMHWRLRF